MATLEPFLREPAPGHGPVKTNLVQRRERSHGKGNSRPSFEADRKIDARSKTGKAPGRNTDMHEPANESLLTDVSGFAPTVARSSHRSPPRSLRRGRAVAPSGLDMGHKRMGRPTDLGFTRDRIITCAVGQGRLAVARAAGRGRASASEGVNLSCASEASIADDERAVIPCDH